MLNEDHQFWKKPDIAPNSYITGLRVNNSLWKNEYVEFVPRNGRRVNWYICGPTVYSESHLGHAKTYLCFDTIRKIMERYFRYDVYQVMNITNIDDKIIAQAAQEKVDFFVFSNRWEKDFFDVCKALNIDPPNVITRVTEYVPEIVAFIQKIIDNGYAYEANGSVYFDTNKFKGTDNHNYPKLKPKAADNPKDNPEIDQNQFTQEKKNAIDFALWKKAKEGEPSWDSPWGKGRPGWHIECSAMCSSELSDLPVDLHTGGDDLKFPHHDNELAQSEAYFDCEQWMNYFLHTGRLDIKGCKMSKSLKNFITINHILKLTTPRILRLFYNLTRYDNILNYDPDDNFSQATNIDKKISEFFKSLKFYLRNQNERIMGQTQKLTPEEREILDKIAESKNLVHEAFCDNFNTPKVFSVIQDLVNRVNKYVDSQAEKANWVVLNNTYLFVKDILNCMGFDYEENVVSDDSTEKAIDILVDFRKQVRTKAKEMNDKVLFELCGEYRDRLLKELNVQIEEKGDTTIWKKVEEVKNAEPVKKMPAKVKEPEELFLPSELFTKDKKLSGKFGKYTKDENGIPVSFPDGKPLSDKERKYCLKEYEKYVEKYKKATQK